jgi:hypothetical protein
MISNALKNGYYYLVDLRGINEGPQPKKAPANSKKRKIDEDNDENKRYDKMNHSWNIAQLRPFFS